MEAEVRANRSTTDRHLPPGSRLIRRGDDEYLVSAEVSDEQLEFASRHFERKSLGGPAQQMTDFAQPLLDATDGSLEQMDRALKLGMLFWNLSIIEDMNERDRMLDDMANKLAPDEAANQDLRAIAQQMIDRHRLMFPDLHR